MMVTMMITIMVTKMMRMTITMQNPVTMDQINMNNDYHIANANGMMEIMKKSQTV